MNILTLDAESYYDSDFTLKKLTIESYVRNPRFEVHGWGIRWPDGTRQWFTHEEAKKIFAAIDWSRVTALAHHAHFDGLVLSHVYGVKPKLWLDTLSMARLVLGTAQSLSLESLAEHYGLAPKSVPYNLFKGKHWGELTTSEQEQLAEGCLWDCSLTHSIFLELAKEFPISELLVVDATIRCFTEGCLEGDLEILGKVWTDESRRKGLLLSELGLSERDLQSSATFAELLRAEGVEPAVKPSPRHPERTVFAFAKTDDFMRELAEDESRAGDLARARLGVKSTIVQTRAERIGDAATRGPLCIYLAPYAAHTLRWGGGDKSNYHNLPRVGMLRQAIKVPKGYKMAKVDASQIECRLLNTLAGQTDVVEMFRNNEDIYIKRASELYQREITKADKAERGTGKQVELSGGYGCGAATFVATAKKGAYGPPVTLTLEQGLQLRDLYRSTHPAVVNYWGLAGRMLARIGGGAPMWWGPMEIKNKRIYLPNGTWLNFDSLEYDQETANWRYKTRQGWQKIWGSSLVAETTQALARVLTAGVIARARENGLRVVWTTHDDVVVLVKDDQWAQPTLDWLKAEMVRVPDWLPDLPLAVEGELTERYG